MENEGDPTEEKERFLIKLFPIRRDTYSEKKIFIA